MRLILSAICAACLMLWLFALVAFEVVFKGADAREVYGYGEDLE